MANKENDRSIRRLDKRISTLSNAVDQLYQGTYLSRMDNKKDMDSIVQSIDDSMDSLLSKINNRNISDISSLYLRLQNKDSSSTTELNKSIQTMFDDNKNIIDSINVDNIRKSIQAENYQYDLICKYMTKLEDAIDIKKDNVLSSDNFTKEFINIISGKANKEAIKQFSDKAEVVKKKYKFQDLFEEMYYDASKYGEYFLYHVPYKKAFERLLSRKRYLGNGGRSIRYESVGDVVSYVTVFEAASFDELSDSRFNDKFSSMIKDSDLQVNLIFDESNMLYEPVDAVYESVRIKDKYTSITESYIYESANGTTKRVEDENGFQYDNIASDGLFNGTGKEPKITDKISGSVLYKIPRDEIFPVCMDRTVIGYIKLNIVNSYVDTMVMNGYSYNSLTNNTKMMEDEFDKQNDMLVSHIAGMISDKIDDKFINANLDLKEQIYSVLRYNDKFCSTNGTNDITVTFLPVEDVQHFYFKLNEKTHRGISDLDKAVIPAMVYCMLYLNTAIGQIGRSQDKRVYYVKQNVETNVAKTLLNVVNQLKKGNMGMRQLENMNTIFNVIGKYNDHIIPMNQSGDPPITMEVMQGQQIDTPTELMDRMEDQAVSSTDVPLEFVQSTNQVDYATRFTMSNSKFLRKIYKRQRICQDKFTIIFRNAYNFEYHENEQSAKILLPAPSFLAMTNSQQLIENVKNYATSIAEITCVDQDDTVKEEFINICVRNYLGTYIDFSNVDSMLEEAKHAVAIRTDKNIDDNEY